MSHSDATPTHALISDNCADAAVNSAVLKRSVVIGGRKTSISLENSFWHELKTIAKKERTTVSQLLAQIDSGRSKANLSSATRMFILHYVRATPPET